MAQDKKIKIKNVVIQNEQAFIDRHSLKYFYKRSGFQKSD
jgi:hypothetical protein